MSMLEPEDLDYDEDECGYSYDHTFKPGDYECRECGAELDDWHCEDED